jgi:hypothetical protein
MRHLPIVVLVEWKEVIHLAHPEKFRQEDCFGDCHTAIEGRETGGI